MRLIQCMYIFRLSQRVTGCSALHRVTLFLFSIDCIMFIAPVCRVFF